MANETGPQFYEDETDIEKTDDLTTEYADETTRSTFVVDVFEEGIRLDVFLSRKMGVTRSYTQKLIDRGNVIILEGNNTVKPSLKVKPSMVFTVDVPPPQKLEILPEPVEFSVIHEDDDILVINKPAGLVVHPAPGNLYHTLVHGLLFRYPDIGLFNNVIRPGIVHRLDSTTSGLMVVARNITAMEKLQMQFRTRKIEKIYLALITGIPRRSSGELDLPIGRDPVNRCRMAVTPSGKASLTSYELLWSRKRFSLVKCQLHSGRTHQIRVHFKYIGCPLVGDKLYGFKNKVLGDLQLDRVFLHSWKLKFNHPVSGKKLEFTQPLPDDLVDFLQELLASDLD